RETYWSSDVCSSDLSRCRRRRSGLGVGDEHRSGEPGPIVDDGTGIAEPVDDRGDARTHRQHAVGDDAVEADLPGESLVPVDRIEIGRASCRESERTE